MSREMSRESPAGAQQRSYLLRLRTLSREVETKGVNGRGGRGTPQTERQDRKRGGTGSVLGTGWERDRSSRRRAGENRARKA